MGYRIFFTVVVNCYCYVYKKRNTNFMKILILSCDTGEGHNAAGRAVMETAKLMGHHADMLDMFLLSGKKTAHAVGGAYVGVVKHAPLLFGFIYRIGMAISSARHKSPVYYANSLMAKKLAAYLETHDYDVIVTPHLYPAETLTYMKRKGMLSIPAAAIGTDYTCIPFWEETELDCYFLPHEDLIQEYTRRGVPAEKLLPFGIPVHPAFTQPAHRAAARSKCNLPQDVPIYLVMSGSMGFGKLAVFAAELALRCKNGEHIIIICGNNEKIRRILCREFHFNSRVHVLGYTTHVPLYMEACDIIFTKPGGLTSTEALVKNIPIVHTAPIPGCETANRNFFVKRHLSVSSKHLSKQVSLGKRLLADDALRQEISEAQKKHRKPDAAVRIVHKLEELGGN